MLEQKAVLNHSGVVRLYHLMRKCILCILSIIIHQSIKGAWGSVEGGMGAVSDAIFKSAVDKSVHIFVDCRVERLVVEDGEAAAGAGDSGGDGGGMVRGVVLKDGMEVRAKTMLSNATPDVTFNRLMEERYLPDTLNSDGN